MISPIRSRMVLVPLSGPTGVSEPPAPTVARVRRYRLARLRLDRLDAARPHQHLRRVHD